MFCTRAIRVPVPGFILNCIFRIIYAIVSDWGALSAHSNYLKVFITCCAYTKSFLVAVYGYINHNNSNLYISKYKMLLVTSLLGSAGASLRCPALERVKKIELLDKAIFKLYTYMCVGDSCEGRKKKLCFAYKINPWIFVILGGIFLCISKDNSDSVLFIYLYLICFSFALNIWLIIITHDFIKNQKFKKNHLKLYSPIYYWVCYLYLMVILFFSNGLFNSFNMKYAISQDKSRQGWGKAPTTQGESLNNSNNKPPSSA